MGPTAGLYGVKRKNILARNRTRFIGRPARSLVAALTQLSRLLQISLLHFHNGGLIISNGK
jgi:hypothetical protein